MATVLDLKLARRVVLSCESALQEALITIFQIVLFFFCKIWMTVSHYVHDFCYFWSNKAKTEDTNRE